MCVRTGYVSEPDWLGTMPEARRAILTGSLPGITTLRRASRGSLVADLPVTRLTVESSADFDRRSEAGVPARLLSVTEAAEKLGLTRAGVQRRIDTGTLPAIKVGTTWAIPAGSIRA